MGRGNGKDFFSRPIGGATGDVQTGSGRFGAGLQLQGGETGGGRGIFPAVEEGVVVDGVDPAVRLLAGQSKGRNVLDLPRIGL